MKKRLGVLLLLGSLVAFGLAIPNLYSQSQNVAPAKQTTSFWQRWFGKPAADTVKPSAELKPVETKASDMKFRSYGIVPAEDVQMEPAPYILLSPSLSSAEKTKIDDWLKDKNFEVFYNVDDMLKNRNDIKTTDKTFLVGSFVLQNTTIQNGKFYGIPQKIADELGLPPSVIDIKGEVKLKNNTVFQNATINVNGALIMYDNTKLREGKAIIGKDGSIYLKGKEGTNVLSGMDFTCSTYNPFDLEGGYISAYMASDGYQIANGLIAIGSDSHTRLENNEIHHCFAGIYVEPGAQLTAVGNNIHHTIYGVWFGNCNQISGVCNGDRNPPRGELEGNQISSSKVGVFVERGRPDISPDNRFTAGDVGMQIALLNMSPQTSGSSDNMLIAYYNDAWPVSTIRDASTRLSTTYDTYSGYDSRRGTISYSSIISDSRNPKNVVNVGPSSRMPQTAAVGCSLIR